MTPGSAEAVLAEILRLDVLPRQIGREPAHADRAAALELAMALVASGRDKNLPPLLRSLVFLPFLHADQPIDRERAVALFAGLRRETQDPLFEEFHEFALRRREDMLR